MLDYGSGINDYISEILTVESIGIGVMHSQYFCFLSPGILNTLN